MKDLEMNLRKILTRPEISNNNKTRENNQVSDHVRREMGENTRMKNTGEKEENENVKEEENEDITRVEGGEEE